MRRRPSFLDIFFLLGFGAIGCGGAEFEIDYDGGLTAGGAGGSSSRDSANTGGSAGTPGSDDAHFDVANDGAARDTSDATVDDRVDGVSSDKDASGDALIDVAIDAREGGADGPDAMSSDSRSSDTLFDASIDSQKDGKTDAALDVMADLRLDASFDVTCGEPMTFYQDDDNDGVGADKSPISACQPPSSGKWVTIGGDCRDDLNKVKPVVPGDQSPPEYSDAGYGDTSKPQGVSFDYDCSGNEEGDPTNAYGGEPDCTGLGCVGVGYVPVNPARSGMGINPYCGSTTIKRCKTVVLVGCSSTQETAPPFRCR
jgi:hypothetical protein